ncbi:MAG: carboxypeptidase regulatory-like domain-containing protein [Anaerolineae bacterium]|nr:carboxypeptidase regulatory-like domain-containing protein [Anaerolineae bacterium]
MPVMQPKRPSAGAGIWIGAGLLLALGIALAQPVLTAAQVAQGTPTTTRTTTVTATPTFTATPSPTLTLTLTATVTETPTLTPTWTETPTQTPSETPTSTPTETPTPPPTFTETPLPTATPLPTETATETPTEAATLPPIPSETPITPDVQPTQALPTDVLATAVIPTDAVPTDALPIPATPTLDPTLLTPPAPLPAATETPFPVETATLPGETPLPVIPTETLPGETPLPTLPFTETPTETPTETATETPAPLPSETPTETPTLTPTFTPTETPLPTFTPIPTATATPTFEPVVLPTSSPEPTATETPTETPTETATETPAPLPSETPTETPTLTPTASETPAHGLNAVLVPDAPTVQPGQAFQLALIVDPAGAPLVGLESHCTFDPALAILTEPPQANAALFPPGAIAAAAAQDGAPAWDMSVKAAPDAPPITAANVFLTGVFTALQPGDLSLNCTVRAALADGSLVDAPFTALPIQITAQAGGLAGVVLRAQGDSAQIEVSVSDEQGHPVASTHAAVDGTFALDNLPAGRYRVRAWGPVGLPAEGDVTVNPGEQALLPAILMPWGDANGDGEIDELDVVTIAAWYGASVPPAPAELDADGDGQIGLAELIALATDFRATTVRWQ